VAKIRTVVKVQLTPSKREPKHPPRECPRCGFAGFVGLSHDEPSNRARTNVRRICFGVSI
jgi:hypothetical protein